jgi:hypothetical protein
VFQERDSRFSPLAARCWARLCLVLIWLACLPAAHASRSDRALASQQLASLTSPSETHVGVCGARPSGRLFSESFLKLEIAPPCDELADLGSNLSKVLRWRYLSPVGGVAEWRPEGRATSGAWPDSCGLNRSEPSTTWPGGAMNGGLFSGRSDRQHFCQLLARCSSGLQLKTVTMECGGRAIAATPLFITERLRKPSPASISRKAASPLR